MDTYEKKYKDALNDMRAIYLNLKGDAKLAVEHAFPELRESEDEKVRKCLIAMVNATIWDNSNLASKKACLAWIEKQEQKPAWSEEDERIRKLLIWQVHRNIEDDTNDLAQSVYDGIKGHDPDLEESIEDWKKCLAWLKSLPLSCPMISDNW